MKLRRIITILLLIMLLPCAGMARRTSSSVRNERKEAAQKIERTKKQIKDNLAETRRELRKLEGIEGEMKAHGKRANFLRNRIAELQKTSGTLTDSIAANEARIASLKESYAKSLRAMRKQRQLASPEAFVFSSESFSQAKSRMRYLDELSKWQGEKAEEIRTESQKLGARKERLDSLKGAIMLSLDSVSILEQELREKKHQADAVVGSLKRQSRNLSKVLEDQQKLAKRLDNELNRLIEEEARKASESPSKAPVDAAGSSFAASKGRLPIPIDRPSVVTSTFGRHQHENLSKVEVQNNGIDFETTAGANARAVFPGVVTMIIKMEGFDNVVLVRHGEYLTVYAGIAQLKVHKGQQVVAGENLGTLYTDPADGRTRLHFEVRHEKEKLDPALWLR